MLDGRLIVLASSPLNLSPHRYPAREAGSRACAWFLSIGTEAQDLFIICDLFHSTTHVFLKQSSHQEHHTLPSHLHTLGMKVLASPGPVDGAALDVLRALR